MSDAEQTTTLALITDARRALVEARSLNDFRKVMEVASVAADAARRASKLMEARGIAADVVQAANDAANDAAAVRIEAQAGAGRILREMADEGIRSPGRQPRSENPDPRSGSLRPTVPELIGGDPAVAYQHSSRWQRVAEIPDNVRAGYVDDTVEKGGEITTAGLLRYAADPSERREPTRDDLEQAYDDAARALAVILKYDPGILAGHASNTRRTTKFRKLVTGVEGWSQRVLASLGRTD